MIKKSKGKFARHFNSFEIELGSKSLLWQEVDASVGETEMAGGQLLEVEPELPKEETSLQIAGYIALGSGAIIINPIAKAVFNPVKLLEERKFKDPLTALKSRTYLYGGKIALTSAAIGGSKTAAFLGVSKVATKEFEEISIKGLSKVYGYGINHSFKLASHWDAAQLIIKDATQGKYIQATHDAYDEVITTEATNYLMKPVSKFTNYINLNKKANSALEGIQNFLNKGGKVGKSFSDAAGEIFTFKKNDLSYFSKIKEWYRSNKSNNSTNTSGNAADAAEEAANASKTTQTTNTLNSASETANAESKFTSKVGQKISETFSNVKNYFKGSSAATEAAEATATGLESAANAGSKLAFLSKTISFIGTVGKFVGEKLPVLNAGMTAYHAYENIEATNSNDKKAKTDAVVKGTIAVAVDAGIATAAIANVWNPAGWTMFAYLGVSEVLKYTTGNSASEWIGQGTVWAGNKVGELFESDSKKELIKLNSSFNKSVKEFKETYQSQENINEIKKSYNAYLAEYDRMQKSDVVDDKTKKSLQSQKTNFEKLYSDKLSLANHVSEIQNNFNNSVKGYKEAYQKGNNLNELKHSYEAYVAQSDVMLQDQNIDPNTKKGIENQKIEFQKLFIAKNKSQENFEKNHNFNYVHVDNIEQLQATLKVQKDGFCGPETIRAAFKAGLDNPDTKGNIASILGVDQKEMATVKKMAEENDHDYFKTLNNKKEFVQNAQLNSNNALTLLKYTNDGKFDQAKYMKEELHMQVFTNSEDMMSYITNVTHDRNASVNNKKPGKTPLLTTSDSFLQHS